MDELINEFLIESYENLDSYEQELLSLEKTPNDKSKLDKIFRTIHSIKGTCGFFGFPNLENLTHKGENVLALLRKGQLALTPEIISKLLELGDTIRKILNRIKDKGDEKGQNIKELVTYLEAIHQNSAQESTEKKGATKISLAESPPKKLNASEEESTIFEQIGGKETLTTAINLLFEEILLDQELRAFFAKTQVTSSLNWLKRRVVDFLANLLQGVSLSEQLSVLKATHQFYQITPFHFERFLQHLTNVFVSLKINETILKEVTTLLQTLSYSIVNQTPEEKKKTGLIHLPGERALVPTASHNNTEISLQEEINCFPNDGEPIELEENVPENNIRVEVKLLDKLMNLAGELVLARNQIQQYHSNFQNAAQASAYQRLNMIISEMQEGIMKTRMQPIKNVMGKLSRAVRDTAHFSGKKAYFEMKGQETELDKNIIEQIKDPLIHLIRNAVDHGIEPPLERTLQGKNPEGQIIVKAFHEGGQIHIEVSDDGKGIHPEKIKKLALENKIITPKQASKISVQELLEFIFLPGFSSTTKVTNISGRGVGMDVVKTNIEKIGGTIEIQSIINEGTHFKIKIPLTLAIIPALITKNKNNYYAIPQENISELVYLEKEQIQSKIEQIKGSLVYHMRGKLLPLEILSEVLEEEKNCIFSLNEMEMINIVVFQINGVEFGLIITDIFDVQEIVIKTLGSQLKAHPYFSGATILGKGDIALILNVLGFAQNRGFFTKIKKQVSPLKVEQPKKKLTKFQTILLFRQGEKGQLGILLSTIDRLEEILVKDVETRFNKRDVVLYRDKIMSLIYLSEIFDNRKTAKSTTEIMNVIVYSKNESCIVGLVVDQILDIVEADLEIKQKLSSNKGLLGTIRVQNKVVDLINVEEIIRNFEPTLLESKLTIS